MSHYDVDCPRCGKCLFSAAYGAWTDEEKNCKDTRCPSKQDEDREEDTGERH